MRDRPRPVTSASRPARTCWIDLSQSSKPPTRSTVTSSRTSPHGSRRPPGTRAEPLPDAAFWEFVELHGQPASAVRDFAERFGALQVCGHSKPRSHGNCPPLAHPAEPGRFLETVEVWQRYSGAFAAAMTIRVKIAKSGRGRPRTVATEWAALLGADKQWYDVESEIAKSRPERRGRLQQEMLWTVLATSIAIRDAGADAWLAWAPESHPAVRLGFDHPSTAHPSAAWSSGSLYPALAERLAGLLTMRPEEAGMLHECQGCARPFAGKTRGSRLCPRCRHERILTSKRESARRRRGNRG